MDDELFADLMASVAEAGRIERGEAAPSRVFTRDHEPLAVAAIRERYQLSQTRLAFLDISVKSFRNWEQGRRLPVGPARVLLLVIARHREAVWNFMRER